MAEKSIEAHLVTLSDDELIDLVVTATQSRPGLKPVRDAALGLLPEAVVDAPGPDIPAVPSPDLPDLPGTGSAVPDLGFTTGGVPTFDAVRDRIEGRSGRAIGGAELDADSAIGQSEREKFEAREKAGKAKLDAIRKSMER